MVKLLIANGADANIESCSGGTPKEVCHPEDDKNIIDLLSKKKKISKNLQNLY